jgi:hypothetical protein
MTMRACGFFRGGLLVPLLLAYGRAHRLQGFLFNDVLVAGNVDGPLHLLGDVLGRDTDAQVGIGLDPTIRAARFVAARRAWASGLGATALCGFPAAPKSGDSGTVKSRFCRIAAPMS